MVSVTTPDRSISSTVSYTVPLIKALEVRAVFSTFLNPADFRSRLGGVPIKYTKLQSSYLYRRETEDFTTVTRKTYSHELFPLVGSEKAHGFGSTSKSFLDGSPDRHEVWSDDFQHAEPQLRTLTPGASALAWQSSSTSHADPDYDVTHSLSATLQRGDAASVGNSGYPTIGGIVQTNQGPFFEPASGPISISLIGHWWAGITADPDDESIVEETASNVYTGEFSTAEMVRVGNESLQAFNPVWDDVFWRWDVARFASFAGYQTNVFADYRYVKGNGFESSNPGSSIDCSLGWRNLTADETWYGVERGEARLQVNPPATDTHVLMLHRFQPESAPDPDPEDNHFPPPAVPEYRGIYLLIRAGESTSTSIVIDPIASDAFAANRDGVHSLSLLPVEIDSRDRAVTGKIPNLGTMWGGNKKFEIGFQAGSKVLGKYEIPQSGSPQGVKIYDNADDDNSGIFGEQELNQASSPPDEVANQQVVLAREGEHIRFYTVADDLGTFKINLYLDGSLLATVDHQLKADLDFEKLIAAIEGFVAGDDPPGVGELPTPLYTSAPTAPQPTEAETSSMLGMLPTALAASYPGPTSAPPAGGTITLDANSFREWLRTVQGELTAEQWTPFATYVAGLGYDVNAATGPILTGWNAGAPPDGQIQLPGDIRNRGLVAKVLVYWLKRQMEMGVATGKGVVFGLWDGVKSDWEGVVGILKMPAELYEAFTNPFKTASELYNTFKVLKDFTLEDVKGIALSMFDEFMSNQQARLAWPEPDGASEALKRYMGGYLGGYIGEQVAIAFITAGGGAAVKAGKYIRTIVEKVRQGVKIVGSMALIEGKLPKIFAGAIAKVTSDEDILRRIRAVSTRVKSVPMQARFNRSCVGELAGAHSNAAGKLDRSLGGTVGDNLQAHHLIPWEHRTHPFVEKAARGGFNMNNGGHNGVLLKPAIHQGVAGHPNYNYATRNLLDSLQREAASLTDEEAADLLIRNAGLLRMLILNTGHPLTFNNAVPIQMQTPTTDFVDPVSNPLSRYAVA